ncbi:MAG: beta-lactamase family protein [Salibacteraceae bacterium]|nr:beta-lactamase family protein [Salibacteraceae bacterium]
MRTSTILFALIIGQFSAQAQLQDRMLQIAKEEFGEKGFSGVVGIVSPKESIALTSGFEGDKGVAPISQHTAFSIASLTKNFTAFAILDMMESEELTDSTQIGDWFSCLDSNLTKIEIHQLANHTAAIADFYAIIKQEQYLTNDSVMRFICALDSTEYEPGNKWGYSNSHYFLLSQIVSETYKSTFEEAMAEEYFKPMNMFSAGFAYDEAEYVNGSLNGKPTRYGAAVSGEGGMVASADDMLAFGNTLITSPKFKKLIKTAFSLSDDYVLEEGLRFGYSWFFSEDEHGKFCAFSGRGYGYNSYHRWYYEKDIYYFVLSNRDSLRFKPFRNRITELIEFAD